MLTQQAKEKIVELQRQIAEIYREEVQRPSGAICDICGDGDLKDRMGRPLKVKTLAQGYEMRQRLSPRLCFRHTSGWSLSFLALRSIKGDYPTNDEIDLHFAKYLAKCLMKTAAVMK